MKVFVIPSKLQALFSHLGKYDVTSLFVSGLSAVNIDHRTPHQLWVYFLPVVPTCTHRYNSNHIIQDWEPFPLVHFQSQAIPFICAPGFTHAFFTIGVLAKETVMMISALVTASSVVRHASPPTSSAHRIALSIVLLHTRIYRHQICMTIQAPDLYDNTGTRCQ